MYNIGDVMNNPEFQKEISRLSGYLTSLKKEAIKIKLSLKDQNYQSLIDDLSEYIGIVGDLNQLLKKEEKYNNKTCKVIVWSMIGIIFVAGFASVLVGSIQTGNFKPGTDGDLLWLTIGFAVICITLVASATFGIYLYNNNVSHKKIEPIVDKLKIKFIDKYSKPFEKTKNNTNLSTRRRNETVNSFFQSISNISPHIAKISNMRAISNSKACKEAIEDSDFNNFPPELTEIIFSMQEEETIRLFK